MSELINYLKENNITNNFKIYHKKITADNIVDGKLQIELFDRLPDTIAGKRAIYFMFNNININEDDHCSFLHNNFELVEARELKYFSYIQQFQHMKTMSNADIFMYTFCLRPTEQSDNGHTSILDLMLHINKKYQYESVNINNNSSITYAVQHT